MSEFYTEEILAIDNGDNDRADQLFWRRMGLSACLSDLRKMEFKIEDEGVIPERLPNSCL